MICSREDTCRRPLGQPSTPGVPPTLLLDTSSRADTSDGLCICHKSVSIGGGGGGGSGKQVAVISTGNISSGVSTQVRFNSSTSDCNLSS